MPISVNDEASLWEAVRRTARGYDVLGALGGTAETAAFLVRKRGKDALTVLRVGRTFPVDGPPTMRWEEAGAFGADLELGTATCAKCDATIAGWGAWCSACSTHATRKTADEASAVLLRDVEKAIHAEYGAGLSVYGMVPIEGGGGGLIFAGDGTGTVLGFAVEGPDNDAVARPVWTSSGIPPEFFGDRTYDFVPPPRSPRVILPYISVAVIVVILAFIATSMLLRDRDERGGLPISPRVAGSTAVDTPADPDTVGGREQTTVIDSGTPTPPNGRGEPNRPVPPESTSPPPPPPPPPAPPPDGLTAEQRVMQSIDAYVAAVRMRDLARLRGAYPGMLPTEVTRWRTQFERMRGATDVQVTRNVERGPQFTGDAASVIFVLTLRYTDANGEAKLDPMPLRAVLRREGAGWRLDEVLALY